MYLENRLVMNSMKKLQLYLAGFIIFDSFRKKPIWENDVELWVSKPAEN